MGADMLMEKQQRRLGRRSGNNGRVWSLVAIGGATAAVISGCGGVSVPSGAVPAIASSGSKSTNVRNACAVLTPALASATLHGPVHRTIKAQPNPHETHCQYQTSTGSVDVLVGDWTFINLGGAGSPGDPAKKLSGIGDQAYITQDGLVARSGSAGVEIDVSPEAGTFSGAAANRQQAIQNADEKKLAPKLLGRL
jgi:hypothetical protein